jgi:hypothetical protein
LQIEIHSTIKEPI